MKRVLLVEKNQSNKDLSNKDLSNQNFNGFDFSYTNLAKSKVYDSKLTGANLTNANLTNANLANAILTDANLTNADLTNADLSGTTLKYSILTGANLTGANVYFSILTNAVLTNTNLTSAKLKYANLTQSNLAKSQLMNADLTNSVLIHSDLTDADLSNVKLQHANLSNAILQGTNLTGANLTGANVSFANLTHANLSNTNLKNVDFTNVDINNVDFTNAINYVPTTRRVNPHEIHQEMIKVINNLPKVFELMNPGNETVPILNTSLLINSKLDELVNHLQPTANYNEPFLANLKQNIGRLKQHIDGFGDFTSTTFQQAYRDYSRDIQNGEMQINQMISYPLFFIQKLTPDTICYYLDDWANGSLTAYENSVSCAKGICERFVMSVAAALQVYFDENTLNNSVLKVKYGEIISLILNKEYNSTVHYLDVLQFKTMVLDKCFQEWYGEHTFDEIAPENVEREIQKFKDCVKMKYNLLTDKLNPSNNYEEMVNNYIKTILKMTKGGRTKGGRTKGGNRKKGKTKRGKDKTKGEKRKTKRGKDKTKREKRKTNKRKTCKKRKTINK